MIILPPFHGCLAPSGGFDPLSLSPTFWINASNQTKVFDALTGGALPADGAAIARIDDSTANGYGFSQSTTTARPLRDAAAQNGEDIAVFDGSNDFLNLASSTWASDASALSVFMVVRNNYTSPAANRSMFWISANAVNSTARLALNHTTINTFTALWRRADGNTIATWTPGASIPSGFFLLRVDINPVSQTITGAINGTSMGSATAFGTAGNTDATSSLSTRIGSGQASTTFGASDIATVMSFRRILSASEISSLESWLSTKYNLPTP